MALPTILIDSATGSDSNTSGAGPATAKTGTAATSTSTTNIDITDTVDLSGVATDGSAVIYFNDTTAGHRRFAGITNVTGGPSGSTWHITVDATGVTSGVGPVTWAIGGKRASLLGAVSGLLLENNSAAGDAVAGWIMQLASAHSETASATVTIRRTATATGGPITIKAAAGFSTTPLLTFSNNGIAIFFSGALGWTIQNVELQNSNATKTASAAVNYAAGAGRILLKGVLIKDGTNKFWKLVTWFNNATGPCEWEDCNFQNAANIGFESTGGSGVGSNRILNCVIANCGSHGIACAGSFFGWSIIGNIFAYNATDGINYSGTTTTQIGLVIRGNVFHGNGGDGIEISSTSIQQGIFEGLLVENNRFTFNGGKALNFSGASVTAILLNYYQAIFRSNNFFTNTGGSYTPSDLNSLNEVTVDPSGGLASATKDYTGAIGGMNFMSAVSKALGYPIGDTLAVGTGSSSYNYQDMGLQHKDAGGGGTVYVPIGGPSGRIEEIVEMFA